MSIDDDVQVLQSESGQTEKVRGIADVLLRAIGFIEKFEMAE